MKELTIEEKAKRYDEAIDLVNSKWHYKNQPCFIQASEIFPELKESKDENIRQWFIKYFQSYKSDGIEKFDNVVKIDDILAWLERQGEQERANKVEPKFKIGDWVVFNNHHQSIYQVEKIENGYYILRHTRGGTFRVCVLHDDGLRLWTLQDAKDGDVLWHSNSASIGIFIFNKIRDNGKVVCYCDYDSEDHFCLGEYHTCCWSNEKYIKPATKEQRDLLFAKMKEAGYEWNADKKELIKL